MSNVSNSQQKWLRKDDEIIESFEHVKEKNHHNKYKTNNQVFDMKTSSSSSKFSLSNASFKTKRGQIIEKTSLSKSMLMTKNIQVKY